MAAQDATHATIVFIELRCSRKGQNAEAPVIHGAWLHGCICIPASKPQGRPDGLVGSFKIGRVLACCPPPHCIEHWSQSVHQPHWQSPGRRPDGFGVVATIVESRDGSGRGSPGDSSKDSSPGGLLGEWMKSSHASRNSHWWAFCLKATESCERK